MIIKKTCIVCPKGCELTIKEIDRENHILEVTGNGCKRGIAFAEAEIYNPVRTLQTTVKTTYKNYERLPIKTSKEIPKEKMFDVMKIVKEIVIDYPVDVGDIIAENVLGLGVNLVATATMRSQYLS